MGSPHAHRGRRSRQNRSDRRRGPLRLRNRVANSKAHWHSLAPKLTRLAELNLKADLLASEHAERAALRSAPDLVERMHGQRVELRYEHVAATCRLADESREVSRG